MKKLFYGAMMLVCWKLEDIYDFFCDDCKFYPSFIWEQKYYAEVYK